MKVIEKGKEQVGWVGQYKCTGYGLGNGGCDALLEITAEDIYKTVYSDCMSVVFLCPLCGIETEVMPAPPNRHIRGTPPKHYNVLQ